MVVIFIIHIVFVPGSCTLVVVVTAIIFAAAVVVVTIYRDNNSSSDTSNSRPVTTKTLSLSLDVGGGQSGHPVPAAKEHWKGQCPFQCAQSVHAGSIARGNAPCRKEHWKGRGPLPMGGLGRESARAGAG